MEEEDPFGSILKNSKSSHSQEEILRNCPFAGPHDHFTDSDTQSTWEPDGKDVVQDVILRNCPFVETHHQFVDSDTQSTWVSSQPEGIIMESLPDTDPVNDGDVVQDDDKFLTPPEHHFYSVSDSEDVELGPVEAKSELKVDCGGGGGFDVVGSGDFSKREDFGVEGAMGVGIDKVGSDDLGEGKSYGAEGYMGVGIEEMGRCDLRKNEDIGGDGDVEGGSCVKGMILKEIFGDEMGIRDLGERDDFEAEGDVDCGIEEMSNGDLGKKDDFRAKQCMANGIEVVGSGDLGEEGNGGVGMDLEGEDCDCVIKDHELEVCGGEFDENEISGGETVSNEVTSEVGVETNGVNDTQDIENIDTEETVVCCGDDDTDIVDEMEVQSRFDLEGDQVVGAGGDIGFGMEGNLEAEECDYMVHDTETEVVASEFDKSGVLDGEIMSKKIIVSEEELELGVCGVGTGSVEKLHHIKNIISEILPYSEEHAEEITSNNEKSVTRLNLAKKDHHKEDIASKRNLLHGNVGENGGLSVFRRGGNEFVHGEEVGEVREDGRRDINGIENGGHKENVNLRVSGKRKMVGSDKIKSGKSKEDIEKFKYVKPSVSANGRGEDDRVSREGNVPLSKTEKGPPTEVRHGNVYKGNSSFLKLVYRASEVLKVEVDSDPEVDLLEVLKRKGLKIPRPRWWPPEGFN